MNPEALAMQWIEWFNAGKMAAHLADNDHHTDGLAMLHNQGHLDLLSLVEAGQLQALDSGDFFTAAHVLERLLPDIDVDVERLMAAVEAMVQRGGTDLAATSPNGALRTWLERRPIDAQRVIDLAIQGQPLAIRHLTFALEALEDVARARELALAHTGEFRVGALTAISRIDDASDGYIDSLTILGKVAFRGGDLDPSIESHAFVCVASIYARAAPQVKELAITILSDFLAIFPDSLAPAVAHVIWAHPVLLDATLLPQLLDAVVKVGPNDAGVISQLDHVAYRLVESGRAGEASRLVRALIVSGNGIYNSGSFQGFVHCMLHRAPRELGLLAIDWLLSGEQEVCEALHEILGMGALEGRPLEIDLNAEPLAHEDLRFLCEKAVGWLMFVPVSATSILCAAIRATDGSMREEIGKLMTDLLLNNYYCASQYIRELLEADCAWSCLQPFLDASTEYLDAWRGVPDIPELTPPDEHLRIQHFKRSDEMREVHKAAHEQSFFTSLFKRATVLHGSAMVTMVHDPDGTTRHMDTPMGTYSVSKEVPRQLAIDPIGLDQALRELRFRERAA